MTASIPQNTRSYLEWADPDSDEAKIIGDGSNGADRIADEGEHDGPPLQRVCRRSNPPSETEPRSSSDIIRQANVLFADFDGVYSVPQLDGQDDEPVNLDPRVSTYSQPSTRSISYMEPTSAPVAGPKPLPMRNINPSGLPIVTSLQLVLATTGMGYPLCLAFKEAKAWQEDEDERLKREKARVDAAITQSKVWDRESRERARFEKKGILKRVRLFMGKLG
ncbi:hypothetical protein OEA41_002280 [Lepraria neglecta]|uniref:Uncharacterized protein n=1 Tax=Lepraria neglecta TaxID=209136 RepID=A0AAE0DM45_9LECA|nr:hypothetical protein OEA41_002280 [Lepraria neglecta]